MAKVIISKLRFSNLLGGIHLKQTNRCITTTSSRRGFEEFFPPGVYNGENYIEEDPVSGRPWKAPELRVRSNTDLHKFWYVLLKERNMLMTLDHECKRLGIFVPGPTRLRKVENAMDLVEKVINERNNSILDLQNERKYEFDEGEQEDKKVVGKNEQLFIDEKDKIDKRQSNSI